jgi:hypothetical protein
LSDGHSHATTINIDSLDTDGDGIINKEEFIVAAIGKEVLFSEAVLFAGFGLICNNSIGNRVQTKTDSFTFE